MQIHAFREYKDHFDEDVLEGRWFWRQTFYDRTPNDGFLMGIEWTDMFGKRPKIEFTVNTSSCIEREVPLSCRFLLLYETLNPNSKSTFRIAEFDWSTRETRVGEPVYLDRYFCETLIDSAGPQQNGDLNFLLYSAKNEQWKCLLCRVDSANCQLQPIGSVFMLQRDKFCCVGLNGNFVNGISKLLDTITRYDLETGQVLVEIQVTGLPASIFKVNLLRMPSETGAWSNNCLYLNNLESTDEEAYSFIHVVQLETGEVTKLSHRFDGKICRMLIESNDYLYVTVGKQLAEEGPVMKRRARLDCFDRNLILFRHYRIPIKQPESLFFLAAAALPQPIPEHIEEFLERRIDIPEKFYTVN